MLDFCKPYKLREILEYIIEHYNDEPLEEMLYWESNWIIYSHEKEPTLDSTCYLDKYYTRNEQDEEIPPEFAGKNALEPIWTSLLVMDVVAMVFYKRPQPDVELLYKALVYFDKNDEYLEI